MNYIRAVRLVRRIAYTLEVEIDCGECARLSPHYVDALLDGQDDQLAANAASWALFQSHLEQCPVCAQEFLVLREVARMELDDTWPTIAALLDRAAQGELRA